MSGVPNSGALNLHILSLVLFGPGAAAWPEFFNHLEETWPAAEAHHVPMRTGLAVRNSQSGAQRQKIELLIAAEQHRITKIFQYLPEVCRELEERAAGVVVIKSLDHWPDFGSDIDLLTTEPEHRISTLMRSAFDAEIVPPTLADRLAGKVNYRLPGLGELVEIHFGRIGQTGEHVGLVRGIFDRRHFEMIAGNLLPVPAPEDRIILAALQRMYRHFFFRICDIVNALKLIEPGSVDFDQLRRTSQSAGIWRGVANFLTLVSQYVAHYRGSRPRLPHSVQQAARFGLKKVYPHEGFLRLPLFPQAAALYTAQFVESARRDPLACLRLSLLPPLAAAAGFKYKVTGSDKGVW